MGFERNEETDNELRVSGGREFQSLGAMTENDLAVRAFQIFGATDEKYLEVAMEVWRKGTHIDKDEEDRSDRTGA